MSRWTRVAVIVTTSAMLVTGALSLRAQDADQDAKAEKQSRKIRLVLPWSQMTSLSDEQKQQISDIHKRTGEEVNRLKAKEREEIMALLSDEQKSEAEKIESDRKVASKKKGSEPTVSE